MKNHDHTLLLKNGCITCKNALSEDKNGMLMYKGKYVVYVSHPSQLYKGDKSFNARQRKRHLANSLEGKSLCNMLVQIGEKKLNWDSPTQYVREPSSGAGETCAICYQKINREFEKENR